MKLNGKDIPAWFTHDMAADLMASSAVGRATGMTRDEFVRMLHDKYPTEALLNAFVQAKLAELEAALTPATGPYTVLHHGHAIRCNTCSKISWNTNDVLHRYCGHCRRFHE